MAPTVYEYGVLTVPEGSDSVVMSRAGGAGIIVRTSVLVIGFPALSVTRKVIL